MSRRLALALSVLLAACTADARPGAGDDDDGAGVDAAPSTAGQVHCGETTVCSGEGQGVCCLKLVLLPPGLEARCVADLASCGADSRFACDEAADCGAGRHCCLLDQSGGSSNTLIATCEDACNLFQQELCQGHGSSCDGGRFCCQPDGASLGNCTLDEAECTAQGM
jgi:hypothetical protein